MPLVAWPLMATPHTAEASGSSSLGLSPDPPPDPNPKTAQAVGGDGEGAAMDPEARPAEPSAPIAQGHKDVAYELGSDEEERELEATLPIPSAPEHCSAAQVADSAKEAHSS